MAITSQSRRSSPATQKPVFPKCNGCQSIRLDKAMPGRAAPCRRQLSISDVTPRSALAAHEPAADHVERCLEELVHGRLTRTAFFVNHAAELEQDEAMDGGPAGHRQ